MSKYASLPDLDPSQDIYETPDFADDISTLPTTIGARTTSPAFSDDDRDYPTYRPTVAQLTGHYRHHSTASAAALAESIDRTRLQPNAARGRFSAADVDASHVDFSDRVGHRRSHGYLTSSRKGWRRRGGRKARRGGEGGVYYGEGEGSEGEEGGDSEEDEEETLEGRLARLRREVEELKVQVGEREEQEERARRERKAANTASGEEGTEEGKGAALPSEEELDAGGDDGLDGKRLRTGIAELSGVLETIQSTSIKPTTAAHTRHGRAEANLTRKIISSLGTVAATDEPTDGPQELPPPTSTSTSPPPPQSQPSYTIAYAPTFHTSHSLARAADFDLRLTTLERLLGTTHSSTTHLSNLDKHLPANAIIPTLDDLARQISVLTSTNQPFVEALNRRVKMLTEQAEKLAEARRSAARAALLEGSSNSNPTSSPAAAGGSTLGPPSSSARRATVSTALGGSGSTGGGGGLPPPPGAGEGDSSTSPLTPSYTSPPTLDTDCETKINALYGVLPTIQQLGPLLPSVLDRLRSLRAIHADAGRAAEGLEGIEKRQEEIGVEIARWRDALEKVEGVMKETEGMFLGNVGRVEEWVRALEERMKRVEGLYNGGGSGEEEVGEGVRKVGE